MRSMVEGNTAMEKSRDAVERARELRRSMSPPELVLWAYLRRRPDGFKFRRQHPSEPYVLDFFCREAALAIEVDGAAHDMGINPQRDQRRDALLIGRGIKTLRFTAKDVFDNPDGVAAAILEECASRCPSTALRAVPLPGKGRGGV